MSIRYINESDIKHNLINLSQLVFEVTDACNLNCYYCAYGDLYCGYDKRTNKYLSLNDVKPLIDYLANLWNNSVTEAKVPETVIGFYGGEPLLNFSFVKEVISYIESLELCRTIRYSMTTNAVLLDKYMSFLVEKNFSILISLDGDRESNEYRIRKNGLYSFDEVFQNAKLFQQRYPFYFKEKVNFNAVLHNKNNVELIIDFFKKEFDKIPTLSELSDDCVSVDKRTMFKNVYQSISNSFHRSGRYEELASLAFEQCPEIYRAIRYLEMESNNVYEHYYDLLLDSQRLPHIPTGTCVPFSRKMFVTVNGKILPCEKITQNYPLGNVSTSSVDLDPKTIAELHNSLLRKMEIQCSICGSCKTCLQCVYHIDDIVNLSPKCGSYISRKEKDIFDAHNLNYIHEHPRIYKYLITDTRYEE